ncbi:MAG: PEP/pyruvate-binding domain-containing protein [Thermodesulfobacteriota bacterium]
MNLFRKLFGGPSSPDSVETLKDRVERFRDLVDKNNQVLELIADAGEKLGGEYIFDVQYLKTLIRDLGTAVREIVIDLNIITGNRYLGLVKNLEEIEASLDSVLESRIHVSQAPLVIPMDEVDEDLSTVIGEKMARLGAIKKRLHVRVPEGFVVSAFACKQFFEEAGISRQVDDFLTQPEDAEKQVLSAAAADLEERIRRAALPRKLEKALVKSAARLKKSSRCQTISVRSSALGEDGAQSFAGQYHTVLGVLPENVVSAYKEVVASLYSYQVMRYRQRKGFHPAHGLMAVGCLCMVPARAGGVVYTLDPNQPGKDVLYVVAARGLGSSVVDGSGEADIYVMGRQPPHPVISRTIGLKKEMHQVIPGHGLVKVPVPEREKNSPSLPDEKLSEIAAEALRIERYRKRAQDIEWAVDDEGRIFILQARPLLLVMPQGHTVLDVAQTRIEHPVLMKDQGVVACRGIGYGPVHFVSGDRDAEDIPQGAVLVARISSPRLATAMTHASAVLTDIGTPTGHLAAIAREFRVPCIIDMQTATKALAGEKSVTVDAEENVIYRGKVDGLLQHQLLRSLSFEEAREYRLLRGILKRVAPLNLKDPQSPDFTVANCLTYHDIIRFAHEKAVGHLSEGHWVKPFGHSHYVFKLALDIPIDLVLIDLGGGVADEEGSTTVSKELVKSAPLKAVLTGLTAEGVWATEPADMDLDGFMASATRSVALTGPLSMRPEQNLAILSSQYMNLSLKLGYHFNIVDCFLTERRNDNYIYFRFAGGVTELARRSRRVTLLKKILENHDFVVEGKGDLVIARIKKIPCELMVRRLEMIGRLIGFTRQLDIYLKNDGLMEQCLQNFMKGEERLCAGL